MNILDSIILGIVQGLTEFIPVSSSAHLILVRDLLKIPFGPDDLAYDAILQLASVLALIWFFRKDISEIIQNIFRVIFGKAQYIAPSDIRLVGALILGTIPAVIAGLFLEGFMETTFRSPWVIVTTLIVGAGLLFFADRFGKQGEKIDWKKGFIIGLFQCLALIPGMSRSGSTISGARILGLSREEAARFSFILAFPIILGSGVKKLIELFSNYGIAVLSTEIVIGFLASLVVSYLSVRFFIEYVKKHSLNVFVVYRIALAIVLVIWLTV